MEPLPMATDGPTDFTGVLDATESIICFEKGKTWECPGCGAGIGTTLDTPAVRCTACNANLADHDAANREPREWARDADGNPIGLSAERAGESSPEATADDHEVADTLDW